MRRGRRLRDERGQVSIEWVGVLAIIAAMVAALLATDLGAKVASAVDTAVCQITREGNEGCKSGDAQAADSSPLSEKQDPDRDGLSAEDERRLGTLPGKADSDGDGIEDGDEAKLGTDPTKRDSDGDGIEDGEETRQRLDPKKDDTDGDGLGDAEELELGLSPRSADTDEDGLKDADELSEGTDPFGKDTDGDGEEDGKDDDPLEHSGGVDDALAATICGGSDFWKCPDQDDDVRATPEWLLGEILPGLVAVGDIRDAVGALATGKFGDAFWAAVGVVPVAGDATKIGRKLHDVMKRFPARRAQIIGLVYDLFPDGALRRAALDAATGGGSKALREGGLADDAIEQLARNGTDLRKLADNARVTSTKLDPAEVQRVERNIKRFWPNAKTATARAEALGVESALAHLRRDPDIEILVDGRRGLGTTHGPDIVAFNKRTGRPVVVEAKGSVTDRPLSRDRLRSPVGGSKRTQTAPDWLATNPQRYLDAMRRSSNPKHQRAARLLDGINRSGDPYDAMIVSQRLPGKKGYGGGLDDAAGEIRQGGQVKDVDIVDVER